MTFLKKILISLLTAEARLALKRHQPKIIAVTGNVGKTSAKDAIYTVVSAAYEARKSEKSFNSEIGLPLAILGLPNAWGSLGGWIKNLKDGFKAAFFGKDFPEWLVLEVGADHPGDIEKVCQWLHPDITVLTRMSETPVHVEYFSGPEEMLREKLFLAKALKPGGHLVVNADDPMFMGAIGGLERSDANILLYGESKAATSRIIESEIIYGPAPLNLPRGQYSVIQGKAGETRIELDGTIGRHTMYSIAAAHAVASALGIEDKVEKAFKGFISPRGRMRLLPGRSTTVIIDDTYNSSPTACLEALKALGSLSTKGKKIAVLGDMKELGELSERGHREVGKLAGETLHTLVTVGEEAKDIAAGAHLAGLAPDRIMSFEASKEAGESLADIVRAGDVILVKGSQSMRMERAVEALLEDPSQASALLVRQEAEWKKK